MHIHAILAIARKDAIDVLKNRQTLFGLLTPIFLILFFIFFEFLLTDNGASKIYMYDPDHSNISKIASSIFTKPEIVYANAADDVTAAFGSDGIHKRTEYAMGLIVPQGFEKSVRQGEHPQITVYMDANRMSVAERLAVPKLLADYANAVANPVPPITIKQATINPPADAYVFDNTLLNTVYTTLMIMFSLYFASFLVPALLIEEKEKKTIRMLMVSPASFTDIVIGKTLVALGYQLLLTLFVIVAMNGFTGNIALLVLFVLLGIGMTLALGLLLGCIFKTTTAATSVGGGFGSLLIMVPGILAGPAGAFLIGNNPVAQAMKILPTYYIADALYIGLLNQNNVGGILVDAGVLCGCIAVLFGLAVWALRRQAMVVAGI